MHEEAISFCSEVPRSPPDWRRLVDRLPSEWIEQALQYSGKASIRRRRLPADQVVWLVIALAVYRHLSIKEILDDLDLALPDLNDRCVTSGGISQAKERLGPDAMRWLFEVSAKSWHAEESNKYLFHGLSLLAMDGTSLRLADSAAIREYFGAQNYPNNKVASYPQTRGVTLTAVPTHLMLGAKFAPYKTSEMELAKDLAASVPDNSLTIFDRGFLSAEFLCQLVRGGQGRQFLIPAKRNTKWKLIEGTEADGLIEMDVSDAAMKRDPTLPATWRARAVKIPDAKGDIAYLLTSLTERSKIKAKDLIACYFRRWEIETSYRELKHAMLGSAHTLRSVTVEGVQQEIWGALIAYNLVRIEVARAAAEAKCDPTSVSFILALHTIQYECFVAAATQMQGKIPLGLKRLRQRLVLDLKEARPGRKFDRVVKAKAQRYPEIRLTRKP
jgi:Transposase DDE domain.